jgi:two-component system, sensor histidine kinase and response regulator
MRRSILLRQRAEDEGTAIAPVHEQIERAFRDSIEELRAALSSEREARVRAEAMLDAARDAEVKQRAVVEQLRETIRTNELFAAVLANDLRTPISGILLAGARARSTAPDDLQRPLAVIQTSGKRMARMIDQLLDFSRIRAGVDLPLAASRLDLHAIVQHVVQELAAREAARRVEIVHAGDTRGTWDGDRLAQLFANLIGNALQHGEEGPVRVLIDGSDPATVRARIQNEGSIPEALRPHLFDPWATSRRSGGGIGLGLFIARQVAQAHRGDLELESTAASGTTFALSIARSPW